jgi:hypothetical protein
MGRYDVPIIDDARRQRHRPQPLPQSLLEYITRRELRPEPSPDLDRFAYAPSALDMPHGLQHILLTKAPTLTLRPFQHEAICISAAHALECVHLPTLSDRGRVVACALYLLPEDQEPLWFQVSIHTHGRSIKGRREYRVDPSDEYVRARVPIHITRCVATRPVVGAAVEAGHLTGGHQPSP